MLGKIKNIFKPEKIILNNGKEVQPKASVAPFVIIGLFLSLIVAGDVTGFNFKTIMKRGNQFFVILKDMFPPDLNYMKTVVAPLIETVKISVLGSLIGSFIAIPFAMLCSVNINKSKVVLNPLMFKLLGIVEIIAVIAFVAAVFMGCGYCLIGIIFITLIFGIFYAYTPFMINLRKCRKNFNLDENPKKEEDTAGETTEKEIFSN